MTRRRCCCGGVPGCPSCYHADADTHDCSICDDGDTATIDFNVAFTPYQYGAVEDYSGTIVPFGYASEYFFTDFCESAECTDFGTVFSDSFNSYPNPGKSAEKACLKCDGSYFSSGKIYFKNCCPCDFTYTDPSTGFQEPCFCPILDPGPPCAQTPGPCNCEEPDYTNEELASMCPGIQYNFIECSNWINSYCNNPNIVVSCGFKPARYTLKDDVVRTIVLNGFIKAADIDQTGAGTMQIVTPGLSKKEQNRRVVFKRKAGKNCSYSSSEENVCSFVAIEDTGSGYPLGSTMQNNIPKGLGFQSLSSLDYRLQAAAAYIPCVSISPTSSIPFYPGGSNSKYNHLIVCEGVGDECGPPVGSSDYNSLGAVIVISGTESGNTVCKEFYNYVNPENDRCKRYSMILVATGFTHSVPPSKPRTVFDTLPPNPSETRYPCGTFWSSIIGNTFSTDVRHADTLLYYYKELPSCSVIENNNYCFNKGTYKLGYVRFGYNTVYYPYPYDPNRNFYKSVITNNRLYGLNTFNQAVTNYPYSLESAESVERRAYMCYPGQNGPNYDLIPGEVQGIPTDPNLRTDFEYPSEITLL